MKNSMPVKGFPGYFVTTDGEIIGKNGTALKPSTNNSGHQLVVLYKNGIPYTKQVHRIVLSAFVGNCPNGCEGCHNDGNPSNNHISNLRWDTRSSNQIDSVKHGTKWVKERHPHSKLTSNKVEEIRTLSNSGYSHRKLANQFNVAKGTIQNILNNTTWRVNNG